jgi:hypothetical protein
MALTTVSTGPLHCARLLASILLPVVLLIACAGKETTGPMASDAGTETRRVHGVIDLPLLAPSLPSGQPPAKREFGRQDTQGWITETGAWTLNTKVVHTRFRCATYETGIQLGTGDSTCSSVRWRTDVDFGSRRRHCNNAVILHDASGELADGAQLFSDANCVRVVTRCEGPC